MHYVWRLLVLYLKNDDASFEDKRLKGLVTATAIWKETYGLYLWPASGDLESHLPKAIRENIPEEWRKRVASEYLDVNLLFGSDVEAALVADKLEKWNLKVSVNSHTLYLWICAYLHTFILSYWHSLLLAYLHTCILAYLNTRILTYLHTRILPYLHWCMIAYLHTCILAYLHTYILAYLHTRIPAYKHTCIVA